jgi:hypothetical protein
MTVEMSTQGRGSFAEAMGFGSFVDSPAERDGTSDRREAVDSAQLAGTVGRTP